MPILCKHIIKCYYNERVANFYQLHVVNLVSLIDLRRVYIWFDIVNKTDRL